MAHGSFDVRIGGLRLFQRGVFVDRDEGVEPFIGLLNAR